MRDTIRLGVRTVEINGRHVPQVYDIYTGRHVEMVQSVSTQMGAKDMMATMQMELAVRPEDVFSRPATEPPVQAEARAHRMIDAG